MVFLTFLYAFCLFAPAFAQFSAPHNFLPAAYPLAVRSPYLNTWIAARNGTTTLNTIPTNWDEVQTMGWVGLARVDGQTFGLFGFGTIANINASVIQTSTITPTRTIFSLRCGPVLFNLTFLSPIEPDDLVKQSLPFSYLSVDVTSVDGQAHAVQLYSDITSEWVSGNRTDTVAQWNLTQTEQSVYHQVQRQSQPPQSMQEINNIAEDSTVYYGTKTTDNVSWQSGNNADVRLQFINSGKLSGSQDTNFRIIDHDFVVLGLSIDLGRITVSSSPAVWALGLVRDPVVQYQTGQSRSSYFWTRFSTVGAAIDDFLADFGGASQRAITLDQKIASDALGISTDYADVVTFGTRQSIAGIDFTISKTDTGEWNSSDIKAFMKDTGISRRSNPVDVIYAALPMLLYLNASWTGLLLEPLMEWQSQNDFAGSDLGTNYPQVTGSNATSQTAVEYSGDMLILAWAHTVYSGNGRFISTYYDRLKSWTDYLSSHTLNPGSDTVDGLTKQNSTNLGIKGILGIRSLASISKALGQNSDADHYSSLASNLSKGWSNLATSSGHLLSTYDSSSSPALIYNLYPDRLFNFSLVDNSIYDTQTKFYSSQAANAPSYGLPLDGEGRIAKSHWTMFTAGTVTNTTLRNLLVSMVRSRANLNSVAGTFPTTYDDQTGFSPTSQASPAQGAMFALMALNLPTKTISFSNEGGGESAPNPESKHNNAGAIAGGVVGGIVALVVIVGAVLFLRRRQKRKQALNEATPVPFSSTRATDKTEQHPQEESAPTPVPNLSYQAPMTSAESITPSQQSSDVVASPLPTSGSDEKSRAGYEGMDSVSPAISSPLDQSSSLRSENVVDPSEATRLRAEIQMLRSEVQQIRAERDYELQPPPEYGG